MESSDVQLAPMLTLTLLDLQNESSTREWRFQTRETIRIGRAPDNDVCLPDPRISRYHATLFHDATEWQFSNIGRHGTFVNGRRIASLTATDGLVLQFTASGPRLLIEIADQTSDERNSADESQPVTLWIDRLKSGDETAAQKLWERYFDRIVRMAQRRLGHLPRRVADEEDVALSVFDSLFLGVAEGRFPELSHRDNLWRLLVVMTARKAIDQIHHQKRQKRGGGMVRGESVMWKPGAGDSLSPGFAGIIGNDPTPEFAALLEEETDRLLDLLDDASLREVALLKMQGYTNEEIAKELDCSVRTIERKLNTIRDRWSADAPDLDEA